ncbi:MAG: TetR family transcriptional regulator [Rhodobacteraceae bacterium HLUCCA08]|nr:MAG: TetR family transcriptional regulator [Rhodobacteraceae bacterium HLUCCA08]
MARPIADDHDDKRAAILIAAARLFADQGYGSASMGALAEACGISKANIYHYYASKEAILFDILDTHLRGLRDRIAAIDHAGDDPEEQLRAIVREILMAYQGADAEHEVQLKSLFLLPEARQDTLRGYQRDIVAQVRDRLERIAPDQAADRARMRAVTMSVFAMLNWYYQWNTGAGSQARRDYAGLVVDLTLNGLRGL